MEIWAAGPSRENLSPGCPRRKVYQPAPPQSIFLEQMPVAPVAKLGPPWAHNQRVANQTSQEIKCNGSFLQPLRNAGEAPRQGGQVLRKKQGVGDLRTAERRVMAPKELDSGADEMSPVLEGALSHVS